MSVEKTPAEVQLVEGQQSNTEEGIQTMTTVTQARHDDTGFDPRLTIGLGASKRAACIEPGTAHGLRVVRVNIDAQTSFYLSPNEAVALGAALQAAGVHQMEETRELYRPADLHAPATEGIGGGL